MAQSEMNRTRKTNWRQHHHNHHTLCRAEWRKNRIIELEKEKNFDYYFKRKMEFVKKKNEHNIILDIYIKFSKQLPTAR